MLESGDAAIGVMAIDPIELTRRLVTVQSTTYHEYEVGVFLEELLQGEGWAAERMAVAKPAAGTPGSEGGRPVQPVCGDGGRDAGGGAVDAYGYGSAVCGAEGG